MDHLWKKLKHGIDALSTPPAPKIGRIPLPDVESVMDVKDIVVQLEGDKDIGDDRSFESDRRLSPVSLILRKRKGSVSSSSSPTPQPRCASRSSSSSYPHTPHVPTTPSIVAPTPRWRTGETLREDGWRYANTPAHHERPETTRSEVVKTKRTSSRVDSPSRALTPQSPPASPTSPVERASRSRTNTAKDEKRTSTDTRRRRHESPGISQPSTTAPSTEHLPERALPLQRGTPDATKRPLKGILKSTPKVVPIDPVYLHWQLLPYDPTMCKKKLLFDVALRVSAIRDHSRMPPLALGSTDLDKPAVNVTMTRMTIQCRQLPHWDIVVRNPSGVTCGDVFHAIHDTFNTPLTGQEREIYITERGRPKVQDAFEKRCRDTPELDEYTRRRGMMRVDLLEGKRIFIGLSFPPGSDIWILDLGSPQHRA